MKIKKQIFFALLCLVFHCSLYAVDYYVDASFTGTSDGSITSPWKTLADVNSNMGMFTGGDNVYFKKGQVFSGYLDIYSSGTNATTPLTFSTYGSASEPPIFQYALPDAESSTTRKIIVLATVHDVVIDGIKILDNTMSEADHSVIANVAYGVFIYKSNYITLRNLDISRVGIGIMVQGNNNLITNNTIHNLREIVNTSSPSNDDYGAEGIVIQGAYVGSTYTEGSYNKIYNNYIHDCWAPSSDFTYDGGAVEFSGPVAGNEVLYNKAVNNDGWLQVNAGSGGVSDNNLIAYNLLINNGRIFWFNFSGTLTEQNLKFYNNNVIETVMHYSNYPFLIGADANPAPAGVLDLRNNIFFINTSVNLTYHVTTPFASGQTHDNNIYYLSTGSIGYTLNASEEKLVANTGIFTDISNADPELWDYTLASTSAAIDFGQSVGLNRDYSNNAVPSGSAPDAGILELQQVVLPLEFTSFYGVAKEKSIDLLWKCSDEWEASGFEVQKSSDGHSFQTIAIVGRSAGETGQSYRFSDAKLFAKTAYYRIKGNTEKGGVYSKVIFFSSGKIVAAMRVFPNPVIGKLSIEGNSSLQNAYVLVVSSNGCMVKGAKISGDVSKYEIDFRDLVRGIYFIKVMQDGVMIYQTTVMK
jgi:hypothetical protein